MSKNGSAETVGGVPDDVRQALCHEASALLVGAREGFVYDAEIDFHLENMGVTLHGQDGHLSIARLDGGWAIERGVTIDRSRGGTLIRRVGQLTVYDAANPVAGHGQSFLMDYYRLAGRRQLRASPLGMRREERPPRPLRIADCVNFTEGMREIRQQQGEPARSVSEKYWQARAQIALGSWWDTPIDN